jgi:hypothetical protein
MMMKASCLSGLAIDARGRSPVMACHFLVGGLLAFSTIVAAANASPLKDVERVVAQFEGLEKGETPDVAFEELERDLAKASKELAAHLETHPDDVDALVISARLGRIEHMLTAVEWSGDEAPPDPRAAMAPLQAYLDRAIELDAERADAHYWKARLCGVRSPVVREDTLLYEFNDLKQAVKSAETAVRLEPKNTEYREALTVFLVNSQRFKEAMEAIRPVKKGRHPFYTLLADFDALPIPEQAAFSAFASESFAEQQVMRGRFEDYSDFRVRVYLVPMTADEVESFYREHWESFELLEFGATRAQFLKIKRKGLQPVRKKSDFPDSPTKAKGILLTVAEIKGPEELERLTEMYRLKPIDPASNACLLYTVNYRPVK